ncbi:hypothetical protein [Limoniibacter endophyticus]|uniref:hypothetical protein n=1 Tax=Limoniibacter endophyticus TaxID=1565040 RepID=UPI001678630C|nr:hypothetical protein [Limoniibacter endophyticus]
MTIRKALGAGAILISSALASLAGPLMEPIAPSAPNHALLVHNCHGQPMMGFVPEYGRDLYHAHDADCQPVILNGGQPDGRTRPLVPQQQRRVEPKTEQRLKPQPRRPEQRYSDCHRNVRTHHVPGFNRPVAHRHVGRNCRIEIYERVREPQEALPQRPLRPGGACVQRGSVRYCEGR